ncbi:MAG TPA: cell division protein FtsZ, partial [Clostridia bacterium]|nr:cell division protein FtsZ [Clostridia bacterium]
MFDYEKFSFDDNSGENFDAEVKSSASESGDLSNDAKGTTDNPAPTTQRFVKKTGSANIVVVGIGGGGNNAVNNMMRAGIKSASFIVMNTDSQALNMSLAPPHCKVQLGEKQTGGLGAGSDPEIGRLSAEESREKIKGVIEGIDLLFITAGMGGGTGTGAAPVVAEIAKSMGILTVAVVTKPFVFEGMQRLRNAEDGIQKLKNFVDTLLVIPNQKLLEVLDPNVSFKRAFEIADDVLRQGVQGVSDVIANPALINLDFADVRTVLSNKGLAHMGIGYGKGEKRVIEAVRGAVFSPLLETDIEGATGIIVNICGGEDMLLSEVNEACDIVRQVVDPSANIILGTGFIPDKKDIEITIIATGFYDKRNQVQIATGGQILTNHQTQSVAKAFNDMVAADRERDERQQTPIAPPAPPAPSKAPARDTGYNANLFANRGAQREYNEVFATQ